MAQFQAKKVEFVRFLTCAIWLHCKVMLMTLALYGFNQYLL